MSKDFLSAGAEPPETVYVEGAGVLCESGRDPCWVALGLGFDGIHYVEHPNAFDRTDDKYLGTYKDLARFVNRKREPRKRATSVPWSDVAKWAIDEIHGEIVANHKDGREFRFCPQRGLSGKFIGAADFYTFGLKARALS